MVVAIVLVGVLAASCALGLHLRSWWVPLTLAAIGIMAMAIDVSTRGLQDEGIVLAYFTEGVLLAAAVALVALAVEVGKRRKGRSPRHSGG